ncbi:hypothetical protein QNE49_001368 [Vibrio fluvialis]|nr:hypothetical protein [Vibrio fluvialis]MBY7782999.1 hypothetical protein [Vibrio fluvialis]
MLDNSIGFTAKQLEYHQKKTRGFLRWVWGLALGILIVIFIFATYTNLQLQAVASTFVQLTDRVGYLISDKPDMPDFVKLINENYFGYWAVSGLLLAIMASLGMLKYHSSRTAFFERELLLLYKYQGIFVAKESSEEATTKILELYLNRTYSEEPKVSINPVLDSIAQSTDKILDHLRNKP